MGLYNNSKLYFQDQLLPVIDEKPKRAGKKKKKGKKSKAQLLKEKYGDDIIVKLLLLLLGREKKEKRDTDKKKKKGDTAFRGMRRRKGGGGGFATPGQVKKQRDEAEKKAKEDRRKAAVAAARVPRPGEEPEDVAERVRQVQIATTEDPVEKALLELTGSMSLPKLDGLQGAIAYLGQFAEPLLRPDLTPGQRTQLEQEVVRNITGFRGPAFTRRFAPDPDKGKPTDIKAGVREGDKFVRRVLQTDIGGFFARGGAPAPAPEGGVATAPPQTDPVEPLGGQGFSPGFATARPPAKKPRRRRATGQPVEQFRGLTGVTQQGPSLFSYFRGEPQPQPQPVPAPAPEGVSDVTQRRETPEERLLREERERIERVSQAFGEAIEIEEATRRSLDPATFGRISVGGGTYGELTRKREAERQRVLGKAAEGGRIVAARQPQERTGGLREEVGTEGILEGAFSRINFPAEEEQPPPLGNIGGGGPPPDPPSEAEESGDDPQPPGGAGGVIEGAGTGISPKPKPRGQKGEKQKRNLEKAIKEVRELDLSDYPVGKAVTSKGKPSRATPISDLEQEREQLIKDLQSLTDKTPGKLKGLISTKLSKLRLGQSLITQTTKPKKSVRIGGAQSLFDRTSEGLIVRSTGEEFKIGDYFPEWNDLTNKTGARAQQIRDDFEWNMRDQEKGQVKSRTGFSENRGLIGSREDIIRQAEERFNYTLPSDLTGLGSQRIRRNETIVGMGEKGISVMTPKGFLRYIQAVPKTTPPPLQPISELEGTIFPIPQEQTAVSETSETGAESVTLLRSNYRKNKKIVRELTQKQIQGNLLTAEENRKLQDTLRDIQDYKTQQAATQTAPDLGSGGETETSGYYTQDSDTGQEVAIRFKEPGAVEARAQKKFPGDIPAQTFYAFDREALRGTPQGKVKGAGARAKELQQEQQRLIQEAFEAEKSGETFLIDDSFLMTSQQKAQASNPDFSQRQGELTYGKVGTQAERGISGFRKIALEIEAEANRISSVSGQIKAEEYVDKSRSILVDLIKKQLTPKIVSRIRRDGKSMKQAKAEAKKVFSDKDDADIVKDAEELFKQYGEPLSVGTPQYNKFREAYANKTRKEFGKAVGGEETKPVKVNMLDKVLAEVTKITDDKIRGERVNILGDSIRQALIDRERAKPNPDESLISDYELTKKADFLDYERFGVTSADAIKGANFSKKVVDKYRRESKKGPQPKTKPATPLPVGLDSPLGTEQPPPIEKPKKGKRPRPEPDPQPAPAPAPVTAPEPELQASIETQATTGSDPGIIRRARELEALRRRKQETGFALPPTPQGTQPTLPSESLEVTRPFDVSIEQPDLGDVGFDYDVEQDVEQQEEEDFEGYF